MALLAPLELFQFLADLEPLAWSLKYARMKSIMQKR